MPAGIERQIFFLVRDLEYRPEDDTKLTRKNISKLSGSLWPRPFRGLGHFYSLKE